VLFVCICKTSFRYAAAGDDDDSWRKSVLELNASDERGIDTVRERIKTFASSKHLFTIRAKTGLSAEAAEKNEKQQQQQPPKFIILDEVDAMTPQAQAALRCIIEKYAANCRFCLLCNELSRIIAPLQSRCAQFRYSPLESSQILQTIVQIAVNENFSITQEAVEALVRVARGDMRRAINTLQSAASTLARSTPTLLSNDVTDVTRSESEQNTITDDMIYDCTGMPSMRVCEALLHCLVSTPTFSDAVREFARVQIQHGLALADLVVELGIFALYLPLGDTVRCQLLIDLGDLQYRLSGSGANDVIQRAALVAVFFKARAAQAEVASTALKTVASTKSVASTTRKTKK
jgi:replication factor C subunit 3/5